MDLALDSKLLNDYLDNPGHVISSVEGLREDKKIALLSLDPGQIQHATKPSLFPGGILSTSRNIVTRNILSTSRNVIIVGYSASN